MGINVDFLKKEYKCKRSWALLIVLSLTYILIFDIAFFMYKNSLLINYENIGEKNKLILVKVLTYYVDLFIYFFIIPILSFKLINNLKKTNLFNYFFQREAYNNLYVIKYISLWLFSSIMILFLIIIGIQFIFALSHFWIIGINNAGFF